MYVAWALHGMHGMQLHGRDAGALLRLTSEYAVTEKRSVQSLQASGDRLTSLMNTSARSCAAAGGPDNAPDHAYFKLSND